LAIAKLPNDAVGRTFVFLGDPVKRAIVEELLVIGKATPAQIADTMQPRFEIGRAAVSTHVTQLVEGRVLVRELDRSIRLIDPHGMHVLITEGHRFASTADTSAALITQALRANLDERLQDSQSAHPDIAAFFDSQPTGPTFETDGPIQRPEALDAPQAQALSKDRWRLKLYWVGTNASRPEASPLRPSVAAFYHPSPAHIVIINAGWPPLARLVARQSADAPIAEAWEATYPLFEREVADAIGAAVRRDGFDSQGLNTALHEGLTKRLPKLEQRLNAAMQRRHRDSP